MNLEVYLEWGFASESNLGQRDANKIQALFYVELWRGKDGLHSLLFQNDFFLPPPSFLLFPDWSLYFKISHMNTFIELNLFLKSLLFLFTNPLNTRPSLTYPIFYFFWVLLTDKSIGWVTGWSEPIRLPLQVPYLCFNKDFWKQI